jgi:hypothetical protein
MTRRRKARCQDVRGRAVGVQVDRVLVAGNGVNAVFPIDDVVNNDLVITASFGYTSGTGPRGKVLIEVNAP